ncbi:CotH kinase family protein [Spirosoma sp.]|uniref:CotH kinase family protein n=1 Tax=Spirosoma sp. TaxID=1899569 RepID=UPI002615E673|nr:CotH kinase family protein [Spirosoma sp.]MCX6216996.1 CotH kinase family protein [Spirosoma sp.]
MKNKISILILFLKISLSSYGQQIYINELMASNSRTLADHTGAYEDWIELYNPTYAPVDIGGYYLTDNIKAPTKFKLPTGSPQTVIPANGYLLIWASGEVSRGPLHVSFKLGAEGEQIGLYLPDGVTKVDTLSFGPQRTDISRGRQPDGSANWRYFQGTNVSPGTTNDGKTGYEGFVTTPVFSRTGGFYSTDFTLSITSADPTVTIYYTLDGSDPDPTNPNAVSFPYKNSYPDQAGQPFGPMLAGSFKTYTYSGDIPIADRTSSANSLSVKSSTFNFSPGYFPTTPVFKGTVVRAVAYKANSIASDIVTQTYFVTPSTSRYSLPVVSITLNEKHLFDYNTGIYTAGAVFDNWRSTYPGGPAEFCTVSNYTMEGDTWERPGNAEFFLNNASIINQPIGLRIHGGCSRAFPRKSLRLYSDTDFNYRFFSNRPSSVFYNRLLLRNSGNDWAYSLMIDSYMQTMVRHLNVETQSSRPSVLFLNGEYWGVHILNERYDKYYVNRNFAVDPDSVDIVDIRDGYSADEGDLVKYNELKSYFEQNASIDYTYAKTQIDIDNLADYQIAEVYSGNSDWPQNNQLSWRKRTSQYVPNAPRGQDGRWRWMIKDMDYGLGLVNDVTNPTLYRATDNNEFTLFFRRLLDIPEFKGYFINRFADLLNTTFLPSRTTALLTSFKDEYQPNMQEHFNRWPSSNTYSEWLINVSRIKSFVEERPAYVREHIRNKFGLTTNRNLTVNVSNMAQGYVKVNTIDILPITLGIAASPYPWTGTYFQGNPIRVVAKAKTGFKFQAWQEGSTVVSTDTAYSYNPTSDRTLVAVFELDDSFNSNPPSFNLLACSYSLDGWSATAPAGTYPSNMQLVVMNQADPTLTATIADTVKGAYNLTSGTRINGLGDAGIAFINTGGSNPGFAASAVGGALLALRTTELTQASVKWTGGTVTPNPRQYRIRLRYRIGDSGSFSDLLDASNNPVEYVRNASAGHSQVIGPVDLPATLLNKPYIQLLWQYYWTGVGTSGARDQLQLDDIVISRGSCASLASGNWNAVAIWSCGRVPTVCDDVLIRAGHVVSVTISNAVAKRVQFETNARLEYATPTSALMLGTP